MRLEGLTGFEQGLQAGEDTGPSVGAGSVGGVIFGPVVMRHRYFGGHRFSHRPLAAVAVTLDRAPHKEGPARRRLSRPPSLRVAPHSLLVQQPALLFYVEAAQAAPELLTRHSKVGAEEHKRQAAGR